MMVSDLETWRSRIQGDFFICLSGFVTTQTETEPFKGWGVEMGVCQNKKIEMQLEVKSVEKEEKQRKRLKEKTHNPMAADRNVIPGVILRVSVLQQMSQKQSFAFLNVSMENSAK